MIESFLFGDIYGSRLILLCAYLFANYGSEGLVIACLVNIGLGF